MGEGKATEKKRAGRITRYDILQLIMRGRAFFALIIVVGVFALITPGYLALGNILIMSKHVALFAILGIGMTFVILSGGIDPSVGSVAGLAAMIAGGLINEGFYIPQLEMVIFPKTWMVVVLTLCVGMIIGAINGLVVSRLNVTPFVATLGMLYAARGLAGLRNDGYTFSSLVGDPTLGNEGFAVIGQGEILGINNSIWIMIVLALIAYFVTTRIPFGRHVFAVGGNSRAAELSGVRTKRTQLIVYIISGFCASVVGLIIASQLVASHPLTGTGFELVAIAVVVLGGTSLMGGRGSILGTVIGAFVIVMLADGLVILGFSSFLQNVIRGMVIIGAVVIDQSQMRLEERIALQRQELQ